MSNPDGVLVQAWQAGSERAAAEAVERFAPALGAVAFGVLNDTGLAQEAVQETFYRAAKRIASLQQGERLGPWLMSIARNVSIDMVRRRRTRAEVPVDDASALASADDTSRTAQNNELSGRLQQAVASLPDDQRELFLMKYSAGMRYADIATATGLSIESVGQKLLRIRKKLQAQLKDFQP